MAGFWEWRGKSSVVETVPVAEAAPLEAVEIYTNSAMVHGWVDGQGRRLSDMLNANSHLSVRDAKSTSVFDEVPGSEGDGWSSIDRDDILFVMPPEHVSARQLRVNRRQHRVRITSGPYVIIGNAHLPPGVQLDAYALQKRIRFLAVTQAVVYSTTDPAFERMAKVVLVNIGPIVELIEVLTIS